MKKIVYGFIFILAGLAGCDNFNPDLDSYLNYKVQAGTFLYGSVEISPESAAAGTAITLTVTPDTGYRLKADSLTVTPVKGDPVEPSENGATWTFTMPASDVTVDAEFEALPPGTYQVKIGTLVNGSIVADKTSAAVGTAITLTVTAEAGYRLKADSLKVNDGAVTVSGSGNTWTFTMPESNVTVEAEFEALPPGTYQVNIGTFPNGDIGTDKTSAVEGETVTLTVTPDTGYQLVADSLRVNNGDVTVSGSGPYTFIMPAGDVTVTAQFEAIEYNINISGIGNGNSVAATVNGGAATTAIIESLVTLTVTPAQGYVLTSITVTQTGNGDVEVIKTDDATYTFTMPAGDVTVTAVFGQLYTVTISEPDNGSIEPGKESAAEGETVTLTVTPAGNFRLKAGSLKVNDGAVTVSGSGPYTFTMPASNVTVTAQFEQLYTVTISGGSTNGSIGTNKGSAAEGETVTLTASPSASYKLESITVTWSGNVEVTTSGTGNSRTFTMPAGDVTVTAEFTENTGAYYTITIAPPVGGTITGPPASAQAGTAKIMLYAKANAGYEYVQNSLTVTQNGGGTVEVFHADNTGSFTMPADNVTVTAQFEVITTGTFNVTIGTFEHGTVTGPNTAEVTHTVTLTAQPDTSYRLKSLTVKNNATNDNVVVTASGNTRTFTMPASNVTVTAEFEEEVLQFGELAAGLYTVTDSGPTLVTSQPAAGIANALEWIKNKGANSTHYLIVLGADETEATDKGYEIGSAGQGKANLTITLQGAAEVTITKTTKAGSLFTVYGNTASDVPHLILGKNITLMGFNNNSKKSLVFVGNTQSGQAGKLTMLDGSRLTGNSNSFTSAAYGGGAVNCYRGEFIMQGGVISGNSAGRGAAVVVNTNGTFTKTGGIIYGKEAADGNANTGKGHVIETYKSTTLESYRDSTADENMNTASEGFWEN